jgi:tetratricopeptide (TPR) repeat protein
MRKITMQKLTVVAALLALGQVAHAVPKAKKVPEAGKAAEKAAAKAKAAPDEGTKRETAMAAPPPQACAGNLAKDASGEKRDAAVLELQKAGLEQFGKSAEEKEELKDLAATVKRYEEQSKEYRKEIQLLVEKKYRDKRDLLGQSYEKAIADLEVVQRQERLDAIAQFEEFLQRYPSEVRYTPDVIYRLAELYYEKAQDDQLGAEKQYEATLKLVESGKVVAAPPEPQSDFSRPIALYKRMLTQFPDYRYNDGTYYLLGYVQEKSGKFEEALVSYQTLIAKYPGSKFVPQGWMRLGEYYFEQPSDAAIKNAVDAYNHAVAYKDDPLFDKALYKLGWAYYRIDDFDHAVDTFSRLLDFYQAKSTGNPDEVVGGDLRNEALQYTAISFADEKWGSVDKAKAHFAKIGARPYEAEIFHRLGDVYFDQTKQPEAIASYRMYLSLAPLSKEAPAVQDRIAQAFERDRDFDRGYAEREQLISLYGPGSKWAEANRRDPDVIRAAQELSERSLYSSAIFHHKQALAYKTDGKQELAFKEFQTAAKGYSAYLERFPRSKESYELSFYNAECLYNSFDFAAAAKQYEAVRDSTADTVHAQESAEDAVQAVQHQMEADQKSGKLAMRPVVLSSQRKDGEKIEPVALPELVQHYVDNIDAYLKRFPKCDRAAVFAHNVGVIYYTYNRFDEARTRFQTVITQYPDNMVAKLATNLIVETYLSSKDWKQVEETAGALAEGACKSDPNGETCTGLTKFKLAGRFKLADELMAAQKYDEASAKYVALVDEVQAQSKAGHVESIKEAQSFADKALNNAAVCMEQVHRYESALRIYERLYTDYPKSTLADAALFRVGLNAQQSYDFDKAIDRYNKLIKDYPTSKNRPAALANEAQLLEGDQRYKDAAHAFTQYAELFGDQDDAPKFQYHAAIIDDRMKDYKAEISALQEFQRKFNRAPKQVELVVEANKRIADAYEELGNERAAKLAFEETVAEYKRKAMKPDNAVASNAAAEAAFKLAEIEFASFDRIKITGRGKALENSFKSKSAAMKRAADAYALVIPYKRTEWTLAAFYRKGYLAERFASTVVEAPVPPEVKRLGDEAVAAYQDGLGQKTAEYEDLSVKLYEGTLTEAKRARVLNNVWIRKTLESLNRFRPKEYPLLKEPKSALAFDTTYAPRLADTPDGPSTIEAPAPASGATPPPAEAPQTQPANSTEKPTVTPASAHPAQGSKVSGDEK